MGSRHLTSPSPANTACGSTSRGQVHPEASCASHSIDFAQGSSHRPLAWAEELPLISRSGKREHRRHIITTGQTLSVSTSTFSSHLQLARSHCPRHSCFYEHLFVLPGGKNSRIQALLDEWGVHVRDDG